MTKKVDLILSETWLGDNYDNNISSILQNTINDFVDDNDVIINIETKKTENGLSRFWIYIIEK